MRLVILRGTKTWITSRNGPGVLGTLYAAQRLTWSRDRDLNP